VVGETSIGHAAEESLRRTRAKGKGNGGRGVRRRERTAPEEEPRRREGKVLQKRAWPPGPQVRIVGL